MLTGPKEEEEEEAEAEEEEEKAELFNSFEYTTGSDALNVTVVCHKQGEKQTRDPAHIMMSADCPPSALLYSHPPVVDHHCYKFQLRHILGQRFSNFFQVGNTFISQNVLRTTQLLSPLKANLSFV
jgi:hypothetical protein